MLKDVWKEFDRAELGHSSVHHLLAIHTLLKERGYARAVDIATYLQLTRGSVSITLKKLREKEYVLEDENHFYQLSANGRRLVNAVLSKRRLVKTFLKDIFKLSEEIAEADACKVEHLITQETSAKMLSFIGLYLSDNPAAREFREKFEQYSHHCHQHDKDCMVCELECYFAGRDEMFSN